MKKEKSYWFVYYVIPSINGVGNTVMSSEYNFFPLKAMTEHINEVATKNFTEPIKVTIRDFKKVPKESFMEFQGLKYTNELSVS